MIYNKRDNLNGIDLVSSKTNFDAFNTEKGRYVPPHERRIQHQQPFQQQEQRQQFQSSSRAQSSGSLSSHTNLGSSGSKWDSGRQTPSTTPQRLNNSNLANSGSKWGGVGGGNLQYGQDGLCPPNKRLEEELFDGIVNSGLNFEKYDNIQIQTHGEGVPAAISSFEECNLGPVLSNNIRLSTYTVPTPVQKNAIPIIVEGRDLMACAQTGSGKTAAFLFPMISEMVRGLVPDGRQQQQGNGGYSRGIKVYPTALILAPTRELAIQIHQEAKKFTYRSHIKSVVVYGGADSKYQMNELERGCHILVATPGRLIDMMERNKVCVSNIKYLCIDEADRMLDMGFEPQIRQIVGQAPPAGERQTLMFSATFPRTIQRLAEDFLCGYIFLKVGRIGSTTESITQRIRWIEDVEKKKTLLEVIPTVDGLTLVFTETKRMADHLEEYLYNSGYAAASIHGDRTQSEREAALEAFKSGQVQILVATDVASRGLDISNVKHVINYDLPHDIDDYVHRIGRTGRAGNDGFATAFFNEKNGNIASDLVVLLEEAGQDVEYWLKEISHSNSNRGTKSRRGGGGGGNYNGSRGGGGSSRDKGSSSQSNSSFSGFRSNSNNGGGSRFDGGGGDGGNYSSGGKSNWW
jgi:ATP-dependent RNA helicase DDX3X